VNHWSQFGRALIYIGLGLAALGALLYAAGRWLPLGRLPGDIHIQRGNFTFYFPLVTCILLSLLLTVLLNILGRR